MPTKYAYCTTPGCPNTVKYGQGRCANCQRRASRQHNRRGLGYDDPRWRRTSRLYRAAHPFCETPGCSGPSAHTDHIDGLGPNGPRGHDWDNLRALCQPHHSARTAADQPGGFHAL